MQAPWRDLKKTEMQALGQRRRGRPLPSTLTRLRKLVTMCGGDAEAEASICYHGSLALLFEFDRDWSSALKHRQLEIRKIRRLHVLERQNPSGGYATQNYQDEDLRERREILEQIKSKTITEQAGCTERRDSVAVPTRTPRARRR